MKIKTLILAALLLGTAGIAQAQETYTFTLGGTADQTGTAAQIKVKMETMVGKVNLGRQDWNAGVCERGNLAETCTQAQACAALGVTGGASCTAADALAADARIFPDSLAGRQSFIAEMMVRRMSDAYLAARIVRDKQKEISVCASGNAATLEGICIALGHANGACYVCGR